MQKTDNQLAVALAAFGLCAAFIAVFCLWWFLDASCENAQRRIIMKAAGGVGCFEFWFNRYQSLIGNVLTAGVAGATLLWIARQLVTSNRQAAAAATDPMYRRIKELDDERRTVRNTQIIVARALARIEMHFRGDIAHSTILLIQSEIAEDFRLIADGQDAVANAHASDRQSSCASKRADYAAKVGMVAGNLLLIQTALRRMLYDPSLIIGEQRDDIENAVANIRETVQDLSIAATDLSLSLRSELDRAWSKARQLQRIAFGDDDG